MAGQSGIRVFTMEKTCKVTASVNAGVSIEINSVKILADAFHDRKSGEFSTVTPERFDIMMHSSAFQSPDLILYTHLHGDHFSKELTEEAIMRYPGAEILMPRKAREGSLKDRSIEGAHILEPGTDKQCFCFGDVLIKAFRLPHAGPQFQDVFNYGFLIDARGTTILLTGDCDVAAPALKTALEGEKDVDVAFFNFPWISLKRGREFLADVVRPRHLMLYHFPLPDDDRFGFRKNIDAKRKKCDFADDTRFLTEFLQEELVTIV